LLEWELPLWRLYQQLNSQWRYVDVTPIGLDLNVFMLRIEAKRWDMDLALELLKCIENGFLKKDINEE